MYPWLQDIKQTTKNECSETEKSNEKNTVDKCEKEESGKEEQTNEKREEDSEGNEISEKVKHRNEREYQHLDILFHIIQGFLYDYMFSLQMVSS